MFDVRLKYQNSFTHSFTDDTNSEDYVLPQVYYIYIIFIFIFIFSLILQYLINYLRHLEVVVLQEIIIIIMIIIIIIIILSLIIQKLKMKV